MSEMFVQISFLLLTGSLYAEGKQLIKIFLS